MVTMKFRQNQHIEEAAAVSKYPAGFAHPIKFSPDTVTATARLFVEDMSKNVAKWKREQKASQKRWFESRVQQKLEKPQNVQKQLKESNARIDMAGEMILDEIFTSIKRAFKEINSKRD